jgi:hypothetical protein
MTVTRDPAAWPSNEIEVAAMTVTVLILAGERRSAAGP